MKKIDFSGLLISEAIALVRKEEVSLPKKPIKPILQKPHDTEDVFKYGKLLKEYHEALEKRSQEVEKIKALNSTLWKNLENHIKDRSGLRYIPKKYQSKVWEYAWSLGHHSGLQEVFNYLCDIVDIFSED